MVQKLLLFIILIAVFGCNGSKQSTEVDHSKPADSSKLCDELVTAKDFTGLDGCGMMMINEKGEKLLLAENIPGNNIKDGGRYKIGYTTLEGMASICMAENKIIRLTCIEVFGNSPKQQDCQPSNNGFDTPFLKSLIDKNNIARIERFQMNASWVYKVSSLSSRTLYDCKGKELCGGDLRIFSECFATFKSELKNPKIIFQGEGPKE